LLASDFSASKAAVGMTVSAATIGVALSASVLGDGGGTLRPPADHRGRDVPPFPADAAGRYGGFASASWSCGVSSRDA
jgi:hypothetical protein